MCKNHWFEILQKIQTPNRKAARASASTPETARGFANLNRGSKRSPLAGSPSSRKRLADSYGTKGKTGSLAKSHMTLKRKAMATLTSAKRLSPKKPVVGQKLKSSLSDGALHKRKVRPCRKLPGIIRVLPSKIYYTWIIIELSYFSDGSLEALCYCCLKGFLNWSFFTMHYMNFLQAQLR